MTFKDKEILKAAEEHSCYPETQFAFLAGVAYGLERAASVANDAFYNGGDGDDAEALILSLLPEKP